MTVPAEQISGAGVKAIGEWASGYVERHPRASLNTVGDQFVLGVRTLQYFVDRPVHRALPMAGIRAARRVHGGNSRAANRSRGPADRRDAVDSVRAAGRAGRCHVVSRCRERTSRDPPSRIPRRRRTHGGGRRIGHHRRPRFADHARGDRRDGGDGRVGDPSPRGTPLRGGDHDRRSTHRSGLLRRLPRELFVQRLLPERSAGQLRRDVRLLHHAPAT